MKMNLKKLALMGIMALAATFGATKAYAIPANSLEVFGGSVTTDTVWTIEQSPIILRGNVVVEGGASLTIEAGVVVVTFQNNDGGIVIGKGSQVFVLGTKSQPVIMTSANDVATWTGTAGVVTAVFDENPGAPVSNDTIVTDFSTMGDPKTGSWRLEAQEWRNMTIIGNAICTGVFAGTVDYPGEGGNYATAVMEGVTDYTPVETVTYGGDDDNDDSGTISYLSSRYAGRVLAATNELNGISLGAIGRETDINNIEIMNNVDDGIELWGGTVFIKYFVIWNVGDDSFDCDQGYRGGCQFGLIVQGASLIASSGSGVGDHMFENDGTESNSTNGEKQPRTSYTVYNVTAISNADAGSSGLVYRDNARLQMRRSIFVGVRQNMVRGDQDGGEAGLGYGTNGADGHEWDTTWSTLVANDPILSSETAAASLAVRPAGSATFKYTDLYFLPNGDSTLGSEPVNGAFPGAKLNEIVDCTIYTASTAGAFLSHDAGEANPLTDAGLQAIIFDAGVCNDIWFETSGVDYKTTGSSAILTLPITLPTQVALNTVRDADDIARGLTHGGSCVVITAAAPLDPRPLSSSNAVLAECADIAPAFGDVRFCPAKYRGAFSPDNNWAQWTAAYAYGLIAQDFVCMDVEAKIEVKLSLISFKVLADKCYTVLCSDNGVNWVAVASVQVGDTLLDNSTVDADEIVTLSQVITPDSNKIYKVIVQ